MTHTQVISACVMYLLLWLVELSNSSGVLLGGGGRQLKYLQFKSLVSSSFNNLTEKDKMTQKAKLKSSVLQNTQLH